MAKRAIGIGIPIDRNGDLLLQRQELGDGLFRLRAPLIEGIHEVRQAILIRLLTRFGEDVLEPTMGLPVQAIISISKDDFTEAAIRSAILLEPRVASVGQIKLELDPATRVVRTNFTVNLKDGSNLSIQEVFNL